MVNHDEQVEFSNNVDQQHNFKDENNLDKFITNDDGPGGFLMVHYLLVPKKLTSRS